MNKLYSGYEKRVPAAAAATTETTAKAAQKKINSFVCVSRAVDDEGNEMVSVFKSIVLRVRHSTVCACEESIYSTESRKELN